MLVVWSARFSGSARCPHPPPRPGGFMMSFAARSVALILFAVIACFAAAPPVEHTKPYNGPACTRVVDDYFAKEVWAKVGAAKCVICHKQGGDAEESKLILRDPRKVTGHAQDEVMHH